VCPPLDGGKFTSIKGFKQSTGRLPKRGLILCDTYGIVTSIDPRETVIFLSPYLFRVKKDPESNGLKPTRGVNLVVEADLSLLERIQQYDQAALAEVYDRYFDQIYRYLNYRLGDAEVAADLAGDVFLALVHALKAGKPPRTSLSGWLYTVARNLAADYIRQKGRTVALVEDFASDEPSLTEQVHLSQLGPMLRKALLQLTEEQQHVIALRFGQELSLAETAQLMEKSVGAVKGLQHRALVSLARYVPKGTAYDG
jgi:RNA polymerase sigma-70 factor, ECF subfamily